MKREQLKELGLEDAVIDKIMGLHGTDIESHKTKVTELQGQVDAAQIQLTEANTQIEKFKGMKPEELKAAADEWRVKFDQAQADAKNQLESLKFDHALESALTGARARNPKAVASLLSRDALKLNDDGSILGLKEQLETIQKDNDYLFESSTPTPKIVIGGNNKSVVGDPMIIAAREAAGLPTEK